MTLEERKAEMDNYAAAARILEQDHYRRPVPTLAEQLAAEWVAGEINWTQVMDIAGRRCDGQALLAEVDQITKEIA